MINSYKVEWKQSAQKELKKLPKAVITKIVNSVESLSKNPFPLGSKKISGVEYTFRIRIGDYRIIYTVESERCIIEVIKIGHRKDVYRHFK